MSTNIKFGVPRKKQPCQPQPSRRNFRPTQHTTTRFDGAAIDRDHGARTKREVEMTARTRKWVVLSALCLLSLDLALVAVAAPKAWGWLESGRGSALARAGARQVENLSGALLTRVTHRNSSVYAFIVRSTPHETPLHVVRMVEVKVPREAERVAEEQATREARWMVVETPAVPEVPDCPAFCSTPRCPMSSCPSSSCPASSCPKTSAPKSASSGSATGLPISMLGMTLE
jgi:hypothetical protein